MVRCYSLMTSTKKGGGVITKFWIILQMLVDGVLGTVIFLGFLIFINPRSKCLPFEHNFLTFNCYSAYLKLIL